MYAAHRRCGADDPKPGEIAVKLADFKFKTPDGGEPGEGMGYNDGDSKLFFYAPRSRHPGDQGSRPTATTP